MIERIYNALTDTTEDIERELTAHEKEENDKVNAEWQAQLATMAALAEKKKVIYEKLGLTEEEIETLFG